jgi:hypothetical protein
MSDAVNEALAKGLMLVELSKDQKRVTALHYEGQVFARAQQPDEDPEKGIDTAKRIALAVNLHATQTMDEMAGSAQQIFLRGVELGISEALKVVGGPGIKADEIALAILNQVRKDMTEAGHAEHESKPRG